MKLKVLFLAFAAVLLSSSQILAADGDLGAYETNKIRMEIVKKLGSTQWTDLSGVSEDVRVCFSINEDGKMRLFKVESDNAELQDFVYNKLHNTSMSVSKKAAGELFWITVKFRLI